MNPTATLDDYRWLVSPSGREALGSLALDAADSTSARPQPLLALASALRRRFGPARAHLLLEQSELRRRAPEKFSAAGEMFFTRVGLEQATDEHLAKHKAARFPPGRLADLCCGIGGDLLALARRGTVTGVDRDPVTAIFAEANLRTLRERGEADAAAGVEASDAAEQSLADIAAWHLDPDRRASGRRATRVASYEPGLETIERLRRACPHAGLKLAPAAVFPDEWQAEAELEWISRDGQCRQLVAWFGDLGQCRGRRTATIVSRDGSVRLAEGNGQTQAPFEPRIGRYLHEPDAAILAAGLLGEFAGQHAVWVFEPGIVYLTSDSPVVSPGLATFEVRDILPFDVKKLRRYLREKQICPVEIKQRGVSLRPEQIRQQLATHSGGDVCTLLLARFQSRTIAVVADRMR